LCRRLHLGDRRRCLHHRRRRLRRCHRRRRRRPRRPRRHRNPRLVLRAIEISEDWVEMRSIREK